MTPNDIIALYRTAANDNAVPQFCSDSELVGYINEAEEQACIRGSLLFDKTSGFTEVAISNPDSAYTLDDSILTIKYASLTDSGGVVYPLAILDSEEMSRLDKSWRSTTQIPTAISHIDGVMETNFIPDVGYTIKLEVYKLPATKTGGTAFEIARAHQRNLLDWVLYRALSKQDNEIFNGDRSLKHYADFEKYFGVNPGRDLRKGQFANTPHRNKGYY